METRERIKMLIDESKSNPYNISKELGISPAAFTYILKGRNKPSSDMIIKISRYFNVTSDWILGLTDTRNTLDSTK